MRVAIITTYAHKVFRARKELINDLLGRGHQIVIMGPEEWSLSRESASKIGAEYYQLNILRHNTNPAKEVKALLDTARKIKNANVDCILVYGVRMIPNIILAAKLARVRNIVGVVNGAGNLLMLKGLKGSIIRMLSFPLLKLALKSANTVIFQNEDDFNEFAKYKLISRNNTIITNGSGVNVEDYPLIAMPDAMEFLLVTRVTGTKGINEFLEAARIVTQRYTEAKFSLVGPKDDNDGSVDWEKLYNYEQKGFIKYHGESSNVIEHLRRCRVYVFPSYYREGVPRSVLEALSVGRPIITTDSSGCRETVLDGVNGFLVKPKDIEDLVDKMIWTIENPDQVEAMGYKSREYCEEKFNVYKINQVIIKKIEKAT